VRVAGIAKASLSRLAPTFRHHTLQAAGRRGVGHDPVGRFFESFAGRVVPPGVEGGVPDADTAKVRHLSRPTGRLATGILLVVVALFDLVTRTTPDWVGFGLAALGAAYGLTALLGSRGDRVV
jgi:hypothetical protein